MGSAGDLAHLVICTLPRAPARGWGLGCKMPGGRGTWFSLTFLSPHPDQNRGRLADKRTAALPPTRVLKKELTPSLSASDGDSDGSGPGCGWRPGLKQEDEPHVHIMKRRYFYQGPGRCRHTGSGSGGTSRPGSPSSWKPGQSVVGTFACRWGPSLSCQILGCWQLLQLKQKLDPAGQPNSSMPRAIVRTHLAPTQGPGARTQLTMLESGHPSGKPCHDQSGLGGIHMVLCGEMLRTDSCYVRGRGMVWETWKGGPDPMATR